MEANVFESIRLYRGSRVDLTLINAVAFHSDVLFHLYAGVLKCHITKLDLINCAAVPNFILGYVRCFWTLAELLKT